MSYAEVTAAGADRSSRHIDSLTTTEHKKRSQKGLGDPKNTLGNHLTENHIPSLSQEIWAKNANDVPYVHAGAAHFEPGVAKGNVVATAARPDGTTENEWAEKHKHMTPLQQHCSYWDLDNDGVIWPMDTYTGCRNWGWPRFVCLLAAVVINGGLAYPTSPSWIPDPFFRIYLGRVHRDKHGSDSLSYDNQGRFRPQAFEEFFANYDREGKGGLSIWDLGNAWVGQRNVLDLFGITAFFLEWVATYCLLWPADGVLRKEDIRGVYDGSTFQRMADEYAAKKKDGGGGKGKMGLMHRLL